MLQAIHDEERVDNIIIQDHLRETIVKTMEDPDCPWSEVTTRGTSQTPVAMMVFDTTTCHTVRPRLRCMVTTQELLFGHLDILKLQMLRQASQVSLVGEARAPVRTVSAYSLPIGKPLHSDFLQESGKKAHV